VPDLHPPSDAGSQFKGDANIVTPTQPAVPIDVLLETLGVTLAIFGGHILLNWLGRESKSIVTTHGLVASSVSDIGWILLVVCLLNRSGHFHWKLPASKKAWLAEFGWAAVLLAAGALVNTIVLLIGWQFHVAPKANVWGEALRHQNTWIAFQLLAPLAATYEELICRVYLQSRLTQILRGRSIIVVLISSALFAAMHGYSPLGSIGLFVGGLIQGASYQLNSKIPRLVIAHAANNMIVGGFALLGGWK
jgi:membrane protease YdiL (CAAX protease family)